MTPEEIAKLPYRPCVGLMLMNAEGRIFVGQRNDRHKDAWQMPQGGVDKGEDPRDAALRELWEETGVTSDLVEIVAETDFQVVFDGQLIEGADPDQVKANIAKLFKIEVSKVGPLFSGRRTVVKRGQQIARVGQTGSVTSPQAHFELRKGANAVDPVKYLSPR